MRPALLASPLRLPPSSSHSHVSPPCLLPPCARQSVSTGAAQLGGHVGAAPAARGGARPARAGGEGEQADMEQRAAGKSPDKLKAAALFLMKVFGAIAGKGPKKVGSLYVACQLFKIYFKLGTLNLSKSIIRVIDSSKGFDDYPARDQVTYKYYTGRLDVFNDAFLLVLRLSLGHLPSPQLLRNHHLQEYEGIVQAMRTGDVRLLRDTLSANEDRFLRAGVYLLLEKLELHVHVLQRAKDPARAHQVRLEVVVRALAGRGVAVDVDELEGLVATLIALGFVKGYLSHKSKVVVLSKQDPFPRLTGRVLL
ncbi:unnamed protein product [Closterium sp. Naga37s-1]|nr:unnamed protein product [Closterium sp. Naga37s-1]